MCIGCAGTLAVGRNLPNEPNVNVYRFAGTLAVGRNLPNEPNVNVYRLRGHFGRRAEFAERTQRQCVSVARALWPSGGICRTNPKSTCVVHDGISPSEFERKVRSRCKSQACSAVENLTNEPNRHVTPGRGDLKSQQEARGFLPNEPKFALKAGWRLNNSQDSRTESAAFRLIGGTRRNGLNAKLSVFPTRRTNPRDTPKMECDHRSFSHFFL